MIRRLKNCAAWAVSLWLAVSVCRAELIAYDCADNDPYASEAAFNAGQNGGTGFDSWVTLDVGGIGTMYVDAMAPLNGSQAWGLGGTYALGRGLTEAAAEGTWSLVARHGSGVSGFCGFSLRTSLDTDAFSAGEIFRFGMDLSQEGDATRIYYSTDMGSTYGAIDLGDDDLSGSLVEYSVTWSTVLGSYALGVRNVDTDAFGQALGALASGSSVVMLGTGIFGNNLSESLTFDEFGVSSIPEPSSTLLFAIGATALWVRRRKRNCKVPQKG